MSDQSTEHRIGTVVAGKYRLERVLGTGGMGAVYAATHEFTKRAVAVKLMHDGLALSKALAQRFIREAQAPSTIGHPGIVDVLDGGTDGDGSLYLVLEMLKGETLGESDPPLQLDALIDVMAQLLSALEAAHEAGFVHRDIKPDNVFLTRDADGNIKVKLLDFGIAGTRNTDPGDANLTRTGTVLGTPLFMSPEQAKGSRVDQRSDLWSVGAVLYESLAGKPPYQADTYNALIISIVTQEHIPLSKLRPDLPRALLLVIDRALKKDVQARWQTAGEMSQALADIMKSGQDLASIPVSQPPEGNRETALRRHGSDRAAKNRAQNAGANEGPDPKNTEHAPNKEPGPVGPRAPATAQPVTRTAGDGVPVRPIFPDPTPLPVDRSYALHWVGGAAVAMVLVAGAVMAMGRGDDGRAPAHIHESQEEDQDNQEGLGGATAAPGANRELAPEAEYSGHRAHKLRIPTREGADRQGDRAQIDRMHPQTARGLAGNAAADNNPADNNPGTGEPPRLGSTDLAAALGTIQPQLQRCHERWVGDELAARREPGTLQLEVRLGVAASGRVTKVDIDGPCPRQLERCMVGRLEAWTFRRTAERAHLRFPLILQPTIVTR